MAHYYCTRCDGLLLETVQLDELGHQAQSDDAPDAIVSDEDGAHIDCPDCAARYEVVDCPSETGVPQYRIVGVAKST